MITEQLATAVAAAPTMKALDNLARITWRGLAEGYVTETDAERISEAVEGRRAVIRSRIATSASKPASAVRRPPRSPDRQRSLDRRRRLVASGAVPGTIACQFTPGETAVLSVIAREVQRRGVCDMPIDKVAALAGVCRTVVQNALREARRLGLITVAERRRRGLPSLTNIVNIIAAEWRAWLRLGGGFRKIDTTGTGVISSSETRAKTYNKTMRSPPSGRFRQRSDSFHLGSHS